MSLRYALLGLLCNKPMTGYDLKKLFDQSINNFWAAHISQIYRELGALERGGHVLSRIEAQPDRPDKRIYDITAEGQAAFRLWMEQPPASLSKETRDEFMLRIFFGSELSRTAMIDLLERFLAQKKADRDRALPEIEMNIEKYSSEFQTEKNRLYWRLIQKRVDMTYDMLIRWAEESILELSQQEEQPK